MTEKISTYFLLLPALLLTALQFSPEGAIPAAVLDYIVRISIVILLAGVAVNFFIIRPTRVKFEEHLKELSDASLAESNYASRIEAKLSKYTHDENELSEDVTLKQWKAASNRKNSVLHKILGYDPGEKAVNLALKSSNNGIKTGNINF